MAARHKQIGERAGHEQAVGVLCEPAVAHLGKAEHPLDDPDRMFDPGAYLGLGAIFRSLGLIYHTAVAVAAIDEVLGSRCVLADDCPLPRYAWSPHTRVSLPCRRRQNARAPAR